MKALVIIAGVLLILGGWLVPLFRNFNAPTDSKKGCGVMLAGVAVIIGAIVL
jgi:uncharacterized membrane protein